MKADELRNLISSVRDAVASLRGCVKAERVNEARILRNVLEELRSARLERRNVKVEARAASMIENADRILAELGLAVIVDLDRKPTAAETADAVAMDRRNALLYAGRLGHTVIVLSVTRADGCRRISAQCSSLESARDPRMSSPGDEVYERVAPHKWRLVETVAALPAVS